MPIGSANAPPAHVSRAESVVLAWNAAHARRDASALDGVYAADVWFYGVRLSKAECEKRKAAAFVATPDCTQALADTKYMDDGSGGFFVTMTKISSAHGESKRYATYLYIDDGRIIAEGDGKPQDDPLHRSCVTITPDGWFVANETVAVPGQMSSLEAVRGTMGSKHLAELRAAYQVPFLKVSVLACAGDLNALGEPAKGYTLVMAAPGWDLHDNNIFGSADVDRVTKVLSWSDGAASESLAAIHDSSFLRSARAVDNATTQPSSDSHGQVNGHNWASIASKPRTQSQR